MNNLNKFNNSSNSDDNIENLLQEIARKINISEIAYKNYSIIFEKLKNIYSDYEVYAQGSLKLGTIINNTYDKNEKYDIDIVLKYNGKENYKDAEKFREDSNPTKFGYDKNCVKRKKPCWNIKIYNGLSIDLTPAINNKKNTGLKYSEYSVKITRTEDFEYYEWKDSNPIGYYKWFKEINNDIYKKSLEEQKSYFYSKNFSEIEFKPLIRTDLQKSIQILKYLNNHFFYGRKDEEYKPISIIITTFVANVYKHIKEKNDINIHKLILAFIEISLLVMKLKDKSISIENIENNEYKDPIRELLLDDNKWNLCNPTNKNENFMDRWNDGEEGKKRENAFFTWIKHLEKLFKNYDELYKVFYPKPKKIYIEGGKPYGVR